MNTWLRGAQLRRAAGRALLVAAIVVAGAACDGARNPIGPMDDLPAGSVPSGPTAQGCSRTSVGLTPLSEPGSRYQGQQGGLYPGGANVRPAEHDAAGLALAREIGPVDRDGVPRADGVYALVSIGMSNTTQEFSVFKQLADGDTGRDPRLKIVDTAQGGVTANEWAQPGCSCWAEADRRLLNAGVSAHQVAVAWVKLADARPADGWPSYAQRLRQEHGMILRLLKARFPNLRLAYLSSRTYAGYATSPLNPEPYAYESGFAVRWTIEDQLSGALGHTGPAAAAPWLSWGPYLWADGTTPRGDGLTWTCSDFGSDGTHLTDQGRRKVAERLLAFFRTDATAREWYLRDP